MERIFGRLTRDAEVRTVSDEKSVVSFSVAVNDSYRRKDGERIQLTEFYNCSYWLGTKVAEILRKGALVELSGRVSASAWIDQEGNPRASLEFNTSRIQLHGGNSQTETKGKANNEEKNNKPADKATEGTEDDLPF